MMKPGRRWRVRYCCGSGSSPEEGSSSVSRGIRDTACRSCSLQADTRWRALAHHDRAPCPTSCRRLFRLDRKSGVKGKSVSVRVDLGGRRIITKQHNDKRCTKLIAYRVRYVIDTRNSWI